MERTYLMLKPGYASKEVIKEVEKRAAAAGLVLVDSGLVEHTKESAALHYSNKVGEPYYPELETYITSGKSYGMVFEGKDAVSVGRKLIGAVEGGPQKGSIRYDIPVMFNLTTDKTRNVIHASDSVENAKKEIEIYRRLREIYKKKHPTLIVKFGNTFIR